MHRCLPCRPGARLNGVMLTRVLRSAPNRRLTRAGADAEQRVERVEADRAGCEHDQTHKCRADLPDVAPCREGQREQDQAGDQPNAAIERAFIRRKRGSVPCSIPA